MKYNYYLWCVCLLLGACHQDTFDKKLTHSIQRLSEINQNKTSDTIILKAALDSAYLLALNVSTRQHDSLFAAVSRLYGNEFYSFDRLKAQDIYCKGLTIGLRQLSPSDNVIFRLYNNIAQLYYIANDYKMALLYYDSVKINSQAIDAQNIKLNFLAMVAESYMRLDDLISAQKIYINIEPIAKKLYAKGDLGYFYTQYSTCLMLQKKFDEAKEKAKIGLSLFKNMKEGKNLTNEDSTFWANNLTQLAYTFQELGDYQKSENYNLQALNIFDIQKDLLLYRYTLRNTGIMYKAAKRFDKAEQTFTKGLNTFKKIELINDIARIKASFYVNRSEIYLVTKQFKKSISDHDSAIYLFTLYEQQPVLTPEMLQARPVLLSVYADKAQAHIALAENGQDTEGYAKALKLMDKIIELTDDIRADYISDEAKLTLAENTKPAFEKAIQLCYQLYEKTHVTSYLNRAFEFAEHSRGMVLYENTRLDNQLPDNLKAERDKLKAMEAALAQNKSTDALQEYLREKRLFREKVKAFGKKKTVSIAQIQERLLGDNKTALVEYFVGDSSIFCFNLSKNDLSLQKWAKPLNFEQKVRQLRQAIISENNTDYIQLANPLYETYVKDGLSKLPTEINRLILVPDGVLNYVSFDMLPQNANFSVLNGAVFSLKNIDFLIKKYTISYAGSANLLMEQYEKKTSASTQTVFAAFAPQYKNQDTVGEILAMRTALTRDGAYNLPKAQEEVQDIQQIVGGKVYASAQADESTFKKEAPHLKVIHLAMHALSDDNNPSKSSLLFTKTPKDTLNDNDLTAEELQTLTLNADLAVLSACNTGFGKISKGEGVMSLARAFNYAGVPATVTTLWRVPDVESSRLMVSFYTHLKAGMTKDAALRQAKLDYLDNLKFDTKAAPLYWSAFIVSGNTEAVSFDTPLSIWVYLGIGLAFVLSIWIILKFKKPKLI